MALSSGPNSETRPHSGTGGAGKDPMTSKIAVEIGIENRKEGVLPTKKRLERVENGKAETKTLHDQRRREMRQIVRVYMASAGEGAPALEMYRMLKEPRRLVSAM